jgi:hypothetical protein
MPAVLAHQRLGKAGFHLLRHQNTKYISRKS